jgi:GNAT superfamily N-acetyltransferase
MAPEAVFLNERPDLAGAVYAVPSSMPAFMGHDAMDPVMFACLERHPAFQFGLREGDRIAARAHSLPFHLAGGAADLPDQGLDAVIGSVARGRTLPNAVCAVLIAVPPEEQGRGLSAVALEAMAENARRHGYSDLYAPVRPTLKQAEPGTPMADYMRRTRADGLPHDPWLRVHARMGGEIIGVCPASMTIASSVKDWRRWTGLPLDEGGVVEVEGALAPVWVDIAGDRVVYVEPNVWVRHRLQP